MPENFFQIKLKVIPKESGEAELVPPEILQGLKFDYLIVKEGAEEGIIKIEANKESLKKIENDNDCKKLSSDQMKKVKKSYPEPKIKRKSRRLSGEMGDTGTMKELFEIDKNGNRIIDKIQTIRSGFYMIDIPILTDEE